MIDSLLTELFGILGSVAVMVSMFFNTQTVKGSITLRRLNNVGCAFFVVYGMRLGAISTIVLNLIVFVVNIYYIVKLKKDKGNKETG